MFCHYCNKELNKPTGQINRAIKDGLPLFCNKICFGLSKRHNKSKSELQAEKSEYDKKRRAEKGESLRAKKRDSYKKNYNPESAAVYRKQRMHKHVEYCSKPEYKAKKVEYDKTYRAKKDYGEFAEAFLVLMDITNLIDNRQAKATNNLISKSQKRKRSCQKLNNLN